MGHQCGSATYRFGLLLRKESYQFTGGKINPVTNYAEVEKWIAQYGHSDGFYYPPTSMMQNSQGCAVSNSKRPASQFKMPPSHVLQLDDGSQSQDTHRIHASFIIHLVGYLYGVFLQFDDWWVSARVPFSETHNIAVASKVAEHFLSQTFRQWQTWSDDNKARFTNVLYMLNRLIYERDWEHFIIEYIVLDACWRIAKNLTLIKRDVRHPDRLDELCEVFKIKQNTALAKQMVDLRNELFHEALWDQAQPGTSRSGDSFLAPHHLRRLNGAWYWRFWVITTTICDHNGGALALFPSGYHLKRKNTDMSDSKNPTSPLQIFTAFIVLSIFVIVIYAISKVVNNTIGGALAGGIVGLASVIISKNFEFKKHHEAGIAEKKRDVYRRLLVHWERILAQINNGKFGKEPFPAGDIAELYASTFDAVLYASEKVLLRYVDMRSPEHELDSLDRARTIAALLIAMREDVTGRSSSLSNETVLRAFVNFKPEELAIFRLREHVSKNPDAQQRLAEAINQPATGTSA